MSACPSLRVLTASSSSFLKNRASLSMPSLLSEPDAMAAAEMPSASMWDPIRTFEAALRASAACSAAFHRPLGTEDER
jgi:hypothetical protein